MNFYCCFYLYRSTHFYSVKIFDILDTGNIDILDTGNIDIFDTGNIDIFDTGNTCAFLLFLLLFTCNHCTSFYHRVVWLRRFR